MPARRARAAGPASARRGRRPVALGIAVVAAAGAVVAAGCGSSDTGTASASTAAARGPACLPSTLAHSAALPGVGVDVSPAPGTGTANPQTQISFLGAPAAQIREVSVSGARSGAHSGRLRAYSQGNGASFVPDHAFSAGEQVSVHALIGAGAGHRVAFSFRVDTPWSTAGVGGFANPAASPADYESFYTLPGVQAPVLSVTAADRDPAAGDLFLSNGPGAGTYGPLIYAPSGRLLWTRQLPAGIAADDVNVQTYQGRPVLTFWQGRVLALGYGDGADVVLDSHYRTIATVSGGNGLQADLHEFQIAPDAVAWITAYNPIRCDLSAAGGPRDGMILDGVVQAIDMKTGLMRWEWHSLDHVGAGESQTSPPEDRAWDWFHINSIDPQPDGDVFISARNTWAGYQIQGGSGTILWRLGGLKSSFAMGPGTATAWQHDGRILANGDVTFFDDGSDPAEPGHSQSRAITVALDMHSHRASLRSALTHAAPPLLAASQGNMQTLASGNTVVGWGGVPWISEYSRNGALLYDAHLSLDLIFYRAYRHPWSALPLSPPALVANLNNTAEETIVHMSWNGATSVASWRVLAGTSAATLKPQLTVASTGFESSTILPRTWGPHARVEVQALDSAGQLLGTSAAAAVQSYTAVLPGAGRAR